MFFAIMLQSLFSCMILFSQSSLSKSSDCQIIENKKITQRLIYHPQSDFCIIIRSCLFTSISCDTFDNGGAISIDHDLSTLSISQSSFYDCNCYQKKGGAIYLNIKNASVDQCCAIECFSRYGLFLYGIFNQNFQTHMSTIVNCSSGGSLFTCSTLNSAGGYQTISFINSSSNNLNFYNAAGISIMPDELFMQFCTFSDNIGESIISINYLIEQSFHQRSINFINVINNTLKTHNPFPQAIAVFFVDNITLSNAIFQQNFAEYSEFLNFYTLYEAQNVHTIIIDSIFDQFSTRFPMETINCSLNISKDTYEIQFLNTEICDGYIEPSSNFSKKKIIIISCSVAGGILLISIIIIIILTVKKKRNNNQKQDILFPLITSENE